MKFISSTLLLPLFLFGKASAAPAISCGSVGSSSLTQVDGSRTSVTVAPSDSNALCMMFRVTAIGDADLSTLTTDSNLADFNMVPVARSWNGSAWQRTAGAYSQDLEIGTQGQGYKLTIPVLPNLQPGVFVLMPFSHSLGPKETVSRFFHQTTFGPTLELINDMVTSGNSFENWVQTQMNADQTPVTSHREYFRRNVNGELDQDQEGLRRNPQTYKVRNPCDAGARWVKYAFSIDDQNAYFNITAQEDGTFDVYHLGDRYPNPRYTDFRTKMNAWADENNNALNPGIYRINRRGTDSVGARVRFYSLETGTSHYILGGNPQVNVPAGTPSVSFIDLPAEADFIDTPMRRKGSRTSEFYDDTMYLNYPISNVLCDTFDHKNTKNDFFGVLGGGCVDDCQVRYGRYVELDENTIESPDPTGGGDVEACANVPMNFLNSDSCRVATNACTIRPPSEWRNRDEFTYLDETDAILVCGSAGEVANNPSGRSVFGLDEASELKRGGTAGSQKQSAWYMIATEEATLDQLRQKVAWALSQILVVSTNAISVPDHSEIFLNYYDIFVRNAFGNYFDILKEVSYSPMMAEMLSYLNSQSLPYVFRNTGLLSFPDENYAREIMQLFSIGIHKLNIDGTLDLDVNGEPQLTYVDNDIQNFARAWTAFERQGRRANYENEGSSVNRLDPMHIYAPYRDFSPKFGLDINGVRGYIGDGYPLCVDLPNQHFLKAGATYRLLGSSRWSMLHTMDDDWFRRNYSTLVSETSPLATFLCNADANGNCNFLPVVSLTSDLTCAGPECDVDTIRIVKVASNPDIYYEYSREACVETTFYSNSRNIQSASNVASFNNKAMCANGDLPLAMEACCNVGSTSGNTFCQHSVDKTIFATASGRCGTGNYSAGSSMCAFTSKPLSTNNYECHSTYYIDNYYWASPDPCILKAKVSDSGTVAVVHYPVTSSNHNTEENADEFNLNFFNVAWGDTAYPSVTAGTCQTSNGCEVFGQDCICEVSIANNAVFLSLPSANDVLNTLKVGAVDVTASNEYSLLGQAGGVEAYQKNGGGYDAEAVFKVQNSFYKNLRSEVLIGGGTITFSFRNPVQFLNPALREPRDAAHETDAVLKHYFEHPNTAPFLASRMIQRFGTSNPSPAYIQAVAEAFRDGTYSSNGVVFGQGDYGSMEAMVAAIVLHEESKEVLLDSDPTSGSLREPLLKFIGFMRSLKITLTSEFPELRLPNLRDRLGQNAHDIPSVFSFFLPEYAAPGHVEAATITSPEAQVMNGPALTAHVNGHFSLIETGLNNCYNGFGDNGANRCGNLRADQYDVYPLATNSKGYLTYEPSVSGAAAVVDELALLLTAGRLSPNNRALLEDSYSNLNGLESALKLITTTPEFHTTNSVNKDAGQQRPSTSVTGGESSDYKSVVFFNLSGGADTFHILVPHTCAAKDMYANYAAVRTAIALPKESLHTIDATGSGQICETFGIHENLPILKTLYDDNDLMFVSNIGVLQEFATKANWREKHYETALFAHNAQQSEIQRMDIYEQQTGRGVGGRMLDVLSKSGYKTNALSISGTPPILSSSMTPLLTVPSASGYEKVDVMSGSDTTYTSRMKQLNQAATVGSSLMSETYSSLLQQGLDENELLYDALQTTTVDTIFPTDSIGRQVQTAATLMKTRNVRGTDRDIFYVTQGGYDTHSDIIPRFMNLATDLNDAIEAFVNETKAQGLWDSTTIVITTEFARTLTTNTGIGSDHAWGGNAIVLGGAVDGGKILGEFPDELDYNQGDAAPLVINRRGVLLPTIPFESVWNGIAQWFGITNNSDLDEVLPNRATFGDALFTAETMYGLVATSAPTTSSAPTATTPSPTPATPTTSAPTSSNNFDWFINDFGTIDVELGSSIRFVWDTNQNHDVHISPDGSCSTNYLQPYPNEQSAYTPGIEYPFTSLGPITFVCKQHCGSGQKVTFNVIEAVTSAPTVSSSPTVSYVPTAAPLDCATIGNRDVCRAATACTWSGGKNNGSCANAAPAPAPEPSTGPGPSECLSTGATCKNGGQCCSLNCSRVGGVKQCIG